MSALLEIHNMMRQFEGSQGPLFRDVCASVEAGASIALIGASGQGKSTLLRCIAWLDKADAGVIALQGVQQKDAEPREWRKQICYVAQQAVMLQGTVLDNLQAVSQLHKTKYDEGLARKLMAQAGLDGIELSKQAEELSGGEKQRLALIRALLLKPQLLLLDEVTSALDGSSKQLVEGLLGQWQEETGAAYIWISHDLEQVQRVCDTVWFMSGGKLLESCATETFFSQPTTMEARAFIGMTPSPVMAGEAR